MNKRELQGVTEIIYIFKFAIMFSNKDVYVFVFWVKEIKWFKKRLFGASGKEIIMWTKQNHFCQAAALLCVMCPPRELLGGWLTDGTSSPSINLKKCMFPHIYLNKHFNDDSIISVYFSRIHSGIYSYSELFTQKALVVEWLLVTTVLCTID